MMSDPLKKKHSDEDNARKFVRLVFDHGRITCQSIQKAIAMTTSGDVSFPTTDDNSLEISLSILGTSIAILKGYSKVMSRERGIQIESLCKHSIENDYDLPTEDATKLVHAIDEYQEAFNRAIHSKINPFLEISYIMLMRCFGQDFKILCLKGSSNLKFFVHQVVGDLMTLSVDQAIEFWVNAN